MQIGIFLPNWVGDVVMATPALRAIRGQFGRQATLIGIMRPYVADVLSGTTWLDKCIHYDRRRMSNMARLAGQLRQERLDAVLMFSNSFTTAALARLSGSPRRIGFAMHGRGWLLTDRLQPRREGRGLVPVSAVDHYLEVVSLLGARPRGRRPELGTTLQQEESADAVWARFGWSSWDRVVVLNTGGAYGAAKTWPAGHFAQLARRLLHARDVKVLILCGPAERQSVREICQQVDDVRVQCLADQTLAIGLSKACVRRSTLMVTTDSGPRHFGAAFGVPTVTLFGPTDPRWSKNYHPESVDLQLDLPCAPCGQRICPLKHHRCMRDLTANQVAQTALNMLAAGASEKQRGAG